MSGTSEANKKKPSGKQKTYEEIIAGFNKLRNEQRVLSHKITEMELEQQEHKLVIATLKRMAKDRKCFRMVGGVLCERTVGDVLPVLILHEEKLSQVIDALSKQLVSKGVELNSYKEQHNVKVKGADEVSDSSEPQGKPSQTGGVLVS